MKTMMILACLMALGTSSCSMMRGMMGKGCHKKGAWFDKMDKDGDGMISMAEWMRKKKRKFKKMDANGDDMISKDEWKNKRKTCSKKKK